MRQVTADPATDLNVTETIMGAPGSTRKSARMVSNVCSFSTRPISRQSEDAPCAPPHAPPRRRSRLPTPQWARTVALPVLLRCASIDVMSTAAPAPAPSRPKALTPEEEAVVRALPRLIHALPRAIDADMVREQRLPNTEYLALMHLSEAPGRQLRMSDLAGVCEMSLSGTTRVVCRLESQGFVQRVRCAEDARGWNAALTDA